MHAVWKRHFVSRVKMAPGGEALTAKNFQLDVDDDKAASISHAHLTNPQNLSFNYREQNGYQVIKNR